MGVDRVGESCGRTGPFGLKMWAGVSRKKNVEQGKLKVDATVPIKIVPPAALSYYIMRVP